MREEGQVTMEEITGDSILVLELLRKEFFIRKDEITTVNGKIQVQESISIASNTAKEICLLVEKAVHHLKEMELRNGLAE